MITRDSSLGRKQQVGVTLVLGVLGLVLNTQPVPLSPGTDLLFGGIPALLAAAALGPLAGLVAGLIAGLATIPLWGHPYAMLILGAEGFTVGFFVRRYGWRPLVANIVFWVFVGVPLLFLTYYAILGVRGVTAQVLFLKQPFNGLVNALMVEALLLLPLVRRWLGVPGAPRLRSALAVVIALTATLPALAFELWSGWEQWRRDMAQATERVQLIATSHATRLDQYIALHRQAVRVVAQLAARQGRLDPVLLREVLDVERARLSGLREMYVADERGRVIVFAPGGVRSDAAARADLKDEPYFRQLRQTRRGLVSEVFTARGGAVRPGVVIAEPVLVADTLIGYVAATVDLSVLPAPGPAPRGDERLRVADRAGRVVYDSRRTYAPGDAPRTVRDSAVFSAVRRLGQSGALIVESRTGRTAAERQAARTLVGAAPIASTGWWIWAEHPLAQVQASVSTMHVRLLSLAIALILLALIASDEMARSLAGPLLRIRETARGLARGELALRVGALPRNTPLEVNELAHDFDEMAHSLSGRTEELEELGEIARSLASALDPRELLRRIVDAAVRLVEPDGCGIALLEAKGTSLRAADYWIGLLASGAGHELPLEASVVAEVARSGQPVLFADVQLAAPTWRSDPMMAEVGSVICAPLTGRSGPLGALLGVRARGNPTPFALMDLRLLERLARHAAIAVENAQLLEDAQAASRAKSDFIATMSHELRTPINAVLGHLQLLEMEIHGPITREQGDALQRIRVASQHLRGLIEEVLSFSRLEAGRAEVHLEPVDLAALSREVASVIEPLAAAKQLTLAVDAPAPLTLETDPDKVRQILINLAGNAVKFTERGEVCIELRANGAGEARLAVVDTGPGIPEAEIDRLFRPFEQLSTGFARPHEGTGLGLYLSSRYAALLGGRLEVVSTVGQGSRFTLVLPGCTRHEEPAPTPVPAGDSAGPHLLDAAREGQPRVAPGRHG